MCVGILSSVSAAAVFPAATQGRVLDAISIAARADRGRAVALRQHPGQAFGRQEVDLEDNDISVEIEVDPEGGIGFPSDYGVIRELLGAPRTPLLSANATTAMIEEELKIKAPPGGWRLGEEREQLLTVFRAGGQNPSQIRLGPAAVPKVSEMIDHPDVNGLIFYMMQVDGLDRGNLPALADYLSLGGSLSDFPIQDLGPFVQRMGGSLTKYRLLL